MKYYVYDLYDGKELLGEVESMDKVRELTNERIRDTDGECYITIEEREENDMKKVFITKSALEIMCNVFLDGIEVY